MTALPASAPARPAITPAAAPAAETPYIRPDVKAYLDNLAAHPRPAMSDAMIAQIRKIPPEMMARLAASGDAPLGTLAVDRTLSMPGPGGEMQLRLFDARAERGAGPVLVFYHGGGFVVGSIATHAALAAEMARQLDVPVVSVEYRLAPEAKWPAAPDDAEAAARWVAANPAALGRQADSLILSGDSAGGTLTLVTALALRDKPAAVPVKMMIPIYPMADASKVYPSAVQFTGAFGLTREDVAYYGKAYAPNVNSPRHSALLADLKGLPPTVLATAALDPLRDGGRAFANKLILAGVPTAYYEAAGNIHGYTTFRKGIPSAQGDLDQIMALARAMMGK
ncbi:MAG: alpha/beta hydrolase [Sphingomonadales bacterium]|nr:alpha/beta hydrolase [Sphingomonadales bacterium]